MLNPDAPVTHGRATGPRSSRRSVTSATVLALLAVKGGLAFKLPVQ
jgi:hypothetical protein